MPSIEIMYVELHGPCYDLDVVKFFNTILAGTGLELTSWWSIDQRQTYGHEDFCQRVDARPYIACSENNDVILERIK
jgi:hypothetical protein